MDWGRLWRKLRFSTGTLLLFWLITAIMLYDFAERPLSALPEEEAPGAVLVIDPGHGGLDGGAVSVNGTRESLINLQIAERAEALAKLLGVTTLMTRTGEELAYPPELETVHEKKVWDQKTRLEMVNSTPGAVLLSIHQNRYPDRRPSGSQVLYAATEGSEALGQLVHANLIACLDPANRRVAEPAQDSIYLMRLVRCPAILVECGFLSNYDEAKKLESGPYQTAIAAILIASCFQAGVF